MAVDNLEVKRNNRQPSIEDAPGVRVVHPPGLVIPIFSGDALLNNWFYLFEKGTEFVQRDLGRSERAARILMEESMRLDNLIRGMTTGQILRDAQAIEFLARHPDKSRKIPSVILVRHEDASPGDYFAISVQRTFLAKVGFPDPEKPFVIPTMYHGLRAVDEEERRYRTPEEEQVQKRLRVGRLLTDLALLTHRGVKRYVHRTVSAIAVWANMHARNLIQTGRHPYDRTYDKDPGEYMLVKDVARLLRAEGSEIEPTGVSRGVTPEPNGSLQIENHSHVMRLQRFITDPPPRGLGADPKNRDVVYGTWMVS